MRKKWKRSKISILIFMFVFVVFPFNVFAADVPLGDVRFGNYGQVVSTDMIYSSEARFSHSPTVAMAPDVMYENSSNGTHWFTLNTVNSDYTRTFNTQQSVVIKLPSSLNGNFDSLVDSVIWSLASNFDYGVRITGGSALVGSTYCTANLAVNDVSIIISGQEYQLNYQLDSNASASVYHNGSSNTYVDSSLKTLNIGSNIPFDLNNFKSISQWNVSLRVVYDINVVVTSYDYSSDYYVSTWTRWNIGNQNESPLLFYIYSDSSSQILNPSSGDKTQIDNFQQNSDSQSSQLGQLAQDSQVQKIDINSASSTVDSNIDMDSVGQYGLLLSALTGNNRVVQMIVIALSVSLVGFIFFGKR